MFQNSQLLGKTGIQLGDKLVAINDCEVSDTEGWRQCLISFNNMPAPGYCVNEDMVHQLDESVPGEFISTIKKIPQININFYLKKINKLTW